MEEDAKSASPDMAGKTVLLTGATNGIGRAGAFALAKLGANLILTGRNSALGKALTEQIASQSAGVKVSFVAADLSIQAEVHKLAREVMAKTTQLHVLINNAGALFPRREVTPDGLEMTFALNHVAPFLLTTELLPLITSTSGSRVITTSSTAHRGARIDWEDLNSTRSYRGFTVYGRSKLANILFTTELARRTAPAGVTANCFHPGVVRTGFGHNRPGVVDIALKLASPFLISPEAGASTMVYLASSPAVDGVTGSYFEKCKAVKPSPAAQSEEDAHKLWALTENLLVTSKQA